MPVISTSFNRFLKVAAVSLGLIGCASAQMPTLSEAEHQWLGQQIYANECNSKFECLTSWNAGEDFPSLGIGHFIWFKTGQSEPFEETFPVFLQYLQAQGITLPTWLNDLESLDSPWPNRANFQADLDSKRMQELRNFLYDTRHQQSAFIAQRLVNTLPNLLQETTPNLRDTVENNFYRIANSAPPFGLYALIDYVHFKGSGVNPKERYADQGWGLQQVLLEMEENGGLDSFVKAAEVVLTRRVENAPPQRRESRWLQGWKNRLQTYLAR